MSNHPPSGKSYNHPKNASLIRAHAQLCAAEIIMRDARRELNTYAKRKDLASIALMLVRDIEMLQAEIDKAIAANQ